MNELIVERSEIFDPKIIISNLVRIKTSYNTVELNNKLTNILNTLPLGKKKIIELNNRYYLIDTDISYNKIIIDSSDYLTIIKREEKIAFDIFNGELIKIFIIDNTTSIDLLFMTHHILADGVGILNVINEILLGLDGKNYNMLDINPLTDNEIKNVPFITRLLTNHINKKHQNDTFNSSCYNSLYNNINSDIYTYQITEEDYLDIKMFCKKNKVTINSYISLCILLAYQSKALGLAVSTRSDNRINNNTGGIEFKYTYNKKSFINELKVINKKLKKNIKNSEFILSFLKELNPIIIYNLVANQYLSNDESYHKLEKLLGYREKKEIGLSNLKNVSFSKLNSIAIIDYLFIPPVTSYNENIIGVATYNNHINIVCHGNNSSLNKFNLLINNLLNKYKCSN